MNVRSFAYFVILVCCISSCKLRIDNQMNEQEATGSSLENTSPTITDTLPPLKDIRQGYYAMLVTGNASSFVRGLYQGEASFENTNTPVIGTEGMRGSIRREISFLYSQGLIRKLKIYAVDDAMVIKNYPLIPYTDFRSGLPKDSLSATYMIASNYQFSSRQGEVRIQTLNEGLVEGTMEGNFVSERGDSIKVKINFKAISQ